MKTKVTKIHDVEIGRIILDHYLNEGKDIAGVDVYVAFKGGIPIVEVGVEEVIKDE